MAARIRRELTDDWRARIRVGQIIARMQKHALGEIAMSVTELKAAEILLRKSLPDLSAVTVTADVTHHDGESFPRSQTYEEWIERHRRDIDALGAAAGTADARH